jgi:hypothetical protein
VTLVAGSTFVAGVEAGCTLGCQGFTTFNPPMITTAAAATLAILATFFLGAGAGGTGIDSGFITMVCATVRSANWVRW